MRNAKTLKSALIKKSFTIDSSPKIYIETYGCQMNVNDSEVVLALLQEQGYSLTEDINAADIILVNTCSIRDNAEQRVRGRLDLFSQLKEKHTKHIVVGVIGCMAERLKEQLLEEEKSVDIIVGPDAYRELPTLLEQVRDGHRAINTLLSLEETYADVSPVRMDKNHISAFVSIMRGCNNFCSYCVVPYTRGRERSRDPQTIISEVKELLDKGYKEVTLLGQNVNSYLWNTDGEESIDFTMLIEMVAMTDRNLRVRFATSHPKDLSDGLLQTIAKYQNICRHIHLPIQSGSSAVLERMNRKYTREWYLNRVKAIKEIIPDCTITTDIIAGFCDETEDDHQATLSLMKLVGYEFAYMFKYSERSGTSAAGKLEDNVPEEIKIRRLNEIIALQRKLSADLKKKDIGKTVEVLVEGVSKKSQDQLYGRTSQNNVVVFSKSYYKTGDYVHVTIERCTSGTLIGKPVKDL